MGQKTIPQSLRLDHLKNWNSNWISEKNDYSKLFYFDYTLREYITKICKKDNLNISKINIKKNNQYLEIYLSFYLYKEKKNITEKLQKDIDAYLLYLNLPFSSRVYIINNTIGNLNIKSMFYKNFKNKKKLSRINSNFYNFINTSYIAFYTQSVELISDYLIKDLKRIPKHRQYLNNINKILIKQYNIFENCLGYKIQLKGRVNGRERSNKIVMKSGKTPLNTLKYNIKYDYKEILTPYGICSLKIWLFYKN